MTQIQSQYCLTQIMQSHRTTLQSALQRQPSVPTYKEDLDFLAFQNFLSLNLGHKLHKNVMLGTNLKSTDKLQFYLEVLRFHSMYLSSVRDDRLNF